MYCMNRQQIPLEQNYVKKNIQAFRLTWSDKFMLVILRVTKIEPEAKDPPTQLIIQRKSMIILEEDRNKKFVFKEQSQSKMISLLLGIMELFGQHYLLYVTDVYFAVYHIASIQHQLIGERITQTNPNTQKVNQILTELQTIYSFGFYFSFQCDITLKSKQLLQHQPTNQQYFWNSHLTKILHDSGVSDGWRTPVMQGYFASFQSMLGTNEVTYTLISRRSKYKSGTRFYARGLDDEGNCANTVETEQVLKFGERAMSYVMIRASVPVFWEQRSVSAPVKLVRNKQLTKVAFINHFKKLHETYNRILAINLLQKEKEHELILVKAYQLMFSECFKELWQYCRYHYYDLHDVVKKKTPQKLNMFIHKRRAVLQTFGYFMHDNRSNRIISEQNGVIRVNCMDGLGRSNTLLYKTAFKVLDIALKQHEISMERIFDREIFEELDSNKDCHNFTNMFKYVWAENADFISKMYCGTDSYSSNLTRLGKRGFLDFIDASLLSLARVYNSKFEDQLKQETLDLLLGRINIISKLALDSKDKSNNCPLKVFVSTWNVNACKPLDVKLERLLGQAESPDLVVFCLQEMIPLNPNNVLSQEENTKVAESWRLIVDEYLQHLGRYILVEKVCLVGIWMVIFIEESWKGAVKGVQKEIVRTGMKGTLGNKGATIIRLRIHESTICFTNVHLESGEKRLDIRLKTLADIHEKAFQQNLPGVQTEPKIQFSDFKFFIGDMNFRVDLPADNVRATIKQIETLRKKGDLKAAYKLLDSILKYDQLSIQRRNPQCMMYLAAYNEAPITFVPTYKFDKNSYDYALKKNRVPSWCDRILLWSDYPFLQKVYNSIDMLESDHRPVIALYTLQITRKQLEVVEVQHNNSTAKEFRDSHFEFL